MLASQAAFGGKQTPMNLESACAASIVLVIVLRSRTELTGRTHTAPRWPLFVVAGLCLAAFAPFLSFPFLADDYAHIWNARHFTFQAAAAHFTQADPDHFFRPLVYLAYAAEAPIAQLHPAIWRGVSLLWHAACSVMVVQLLRRLGGAAGACFAGGALFAISGTRPEAVTWVAARFDLMATAFGLAALLLLLHGRRVLSCVLLLAALLSKESAFVVPLLAVILLRFERVGWRQIVRRIWPWFGLAAAVFGYRMALLRGIGGYRYSGEAIPAALKVNLATLHGWLLRSWDAMFFPLNWLHVPGLTIGILLALAVASLAWLAWNHADRRLAVTGILFFLLAALPAHQFLMIGSDLGKSRVLYLPSAGFAMLIAALVRGKRGWIAVVPVLAFQMASLWHNLGEWRAVGNVAGRTCAEIVARLDRSPGLIRLPEFPNTVEGVYFLKTGYPACVWLQRPDRQADVQ
jgi:hypothetical protein